MKTIRSNGDALALILPGGRSPEATTFYTPAAAGQQVGHVVHAAGTEIAPHRHLPHTRTVTGTSEVLVVLQGHCWMDLYDEADRALGAHELRSGDIVVLMRGGHGFRMIEDTVLLEIKQGPYLSAQDKIPVSLRAEMNA